MKTQEEHVIDFEQFKRDLDRRCRRIKWENRLIFWVPTLLGIAFFVFALAHSARACPPVSVTVWPNQGILELAGCSIDPSAHEIHTAFNTSIAGDPDPFVWNGSGWITNWVVNGDSFYIDWDDSPATVETDECGDQSWHGRGDEATPVVCGDLVNTASWPACDFPAGTTTPDCTFGFYLGEPQSIHTSVRIQPDADVDRDGVVGTLDALRVIRCFGAPWQCDPEADMNGDGVVGASDWLAVRRNFGRTVQSYTILGHTQRYYTDLAPCVEGALCYIPPGVAETQVWLQEQL